MRTMLVKTIIVRCAHEDDACGDRASNGKNSVMNQENIVLPIEDLRFSTFYDFCKW